MDYYIDKLAMSELSYYRIIVDKKIPFPRNYICVDFIDNIEISTLKWNETNGAWGKPDKIMGNVELYRLWKKYNRPLNFNEWVIIDKQ